MLTKHVHLRPSWHEDCIDRHGPDSHSVRRSTAEHMGVLLHSSQSRSLEHTWYSKQLAGPCTRDACVRMRPATHTSSTHTNIQACMQRDTACMRHTNKHEMHVHAHTSAYRAHTHIKKSAHVLDLCTRWCAALARTTVAGVPLGPGLAASLVAGLYHQD